MKLNDVRRFSAYVSTIYHIEYITDLCLEITLCNVCQYFNLKRTLNVWLLNRRN